uniref:Serine/threonine-protein kinase 19 n=1 Tax=Auxenochlorella protothecoides TaxID=3075 RepID=A0A1D2AEX6_AUXPR
MAATTDSLPAVRQGKRKLLLPPAQRRQHSGAAPSSVDPVEAACRSGEAVASPVSNPPSAPGGDVWGDDDSDLGAILTDTQAALHILASQFIRQHDSHAPPFSMVTQLYTLLPDRTKTDKELDALRLGNQVRLLQLPHGGVAAVPTDAYSVSLRSLARPAPAATREAGRNATRDGPATAERFLSLVLPRHTGFGLTRTELAEALGPRHAAADLEALLDWGALTRHPTAQTASYIFGLPDAGRCLRSVLEGRLELLTMLQRRWHGETLEAELLRKGRLRRSTLGVLWHLRDVLGAGLVVRRETAVGPMLRLATRT